MQGPHVEDLPRGGRHGVDAPARELRLLGLLRDERISFIDLVESVIMSESPFNPKASDVSRVICLSFFCSHISDRRLFFTKERAEEHIFFSMGAQEEVNEDNKGVRRIFVIFDPGSALGE